MVQFFGPPGTTITTTTTTTFVWQMFTQHYSAAIHNAHRQRQPRSVILKHVVAGISHSPVHSYRDRPL